MKRLLAVLAFLIGFSCGTSSAFTGPVGARPLLSVTQMRHFEMTDPRLPQQLVTISIARVTNPSMSPMTLTLDCTESFHTLDVPARSSTDVLLDAKDASCEVR